MPKHFSMDPAPSVPFHRSLLVRSWAFFLTCVTVLGGMELREKVPGLAAWRFGVYVLAAILVPLLFLVVVRELVHRVPWTAGRWRRAAAWHAGAIVGLTAVDHLFLFDSRHLGIPASVLPQTSEPAATLTDVAVYVVMLVVLELARRTAASRRVQLARAAMDVQLAEARRRRTEAELGALKAELNPHFLGNALASVQSLLRTDVDTAERTLAQLGGLLGRLGRRGAQEVSLREELEGLEPVLEYERLRLSGRLRVVREVGDAGDALVPDMILHPLVENAVKYGLAPRGGGTLYVTAERTGPAGALLAISVRDRGDADRRDAAAPNGTGIGLSNVRSRLAELYGGAAGLELRPDGGMGMEARITLPWRDDDSAPLEPPSVGTEAVAAAPRAGRWDRVRPLLASAARVTATVAGWMLLCLVLDALAARAPVPPTVHLVLMATLVDVVLIAAIRTGIAVSAVLMVRRLADRGERGLAQHTFVAFTFGVVSVVERMALLLAYDPARLTFMPASHLTRNIVFQVLGEMMCYVVVAGVTSAALTAWRLRVSGRTALRLQHRLEEERQRRAAAELRTLQSELNPHFVGNALGVVSSLLRTDAAAAERVLVQLGVLLRGALARAATHEVTLREELVTSRSFLAVEHARLGRGLEVQWRVDESALDARVPHMILQPLIENAVKHGLAQRGSAGRIEVEARRGGERVLELVVRDDGAGPADRAPASAGIPERRGVGLANTRARLSELYGPTACLDLSHGEAGGTVARVRIPWHQEAMSALDLVAGGVDASIPFADRAP